MSQSAMDTLDARVVIHRYGSPDHLAVSRSLAPPQPGPGEVRIRVQASSVQFTDTLIRRGKYYDFSDPPPVTPGYDLVGFVDALGPGVASVSVGDRVADLTTVGANARFAVRPAEGLTQVPLSLDAAAATTLVLSWMTAYQAMVRTAKVQRGERVLVIGGNGAVGLAVIGLAASLGVEVWATASSTHHAWLKDLGARTFPRERWLSEVQAAGGVDVVIDGVCSDHFASPFSALRPGGRMVAIGFSEPIRRGGGTLAMGWELLHLGLRHLWPDGRRGQLYVIAEYRKAHPDHWREDLGALFAMLEEGAVSPRVGEILALEDVADAHRRLEAGGLSGKLVLDPWIPAA